MSLVPKKRAERILLENLVRRGICLVRREHHFAPGWMAPPMPKLYRAGVGQPTFVFRCKTCGQEVVRYANGDETWL